MPIMPAPPESRHPRGFFGVSRANRERIAGASGASGVSGSRRLPRLRALRIRHLVAFIGRADPNSEDDVGCGCILALVAAVSPRLALVLVWIFTNLVDRAFDTFVVPLLGLIVFPFTTLMYVLAYHPASGVTGIGWVVVALGVVVDLTSTGLFARARRA
jgi:hypothetical protein